MREVNGKPIRPARGGQKNRPSRKEYREPAHHESMTAVAAESGIYNEFADVAETEETHGIPRKSLTDKLLLRVFPQTIETESRVSRQLDQKEFKATGKIKLIETTDQRQTWKSDRTLLSTLRPDNDRENFKRITSHTKIRKSDPT